jgi:hypothetical protein
LCIVQGDDAEWEEQSAGLVYANAKCVVSATASKDSDGGCFLPRDIFRHDCSLRGSDRRSLTVRSSYKQENIGASFNLVKDKAENTGLNTRAWAFQERYLARRVLHFCDGVVFFEYNTLVVWDGQRFWGERYEARAGVRPDGTLHAPEDFAAVQQPVER